MFDNSIHNINKSNRVISLDIFVKAINEARSELTKTVVQEEVTYRYIIIRCYSKVLLRSFEVYMLLKEGYPEGAFALSRSLYEAMIIINRLLQGASNNDLVLLQRFFDAANVAHLQIAITCAEWILKSDPTRQDALSLLKENNNELQQYKDKYPNEKFRSYWWADATTFRNLADIQGFTKDHVYKYTSENMHFNAYTALNYLDTSEDSLLISSTYNAFELPLWFSTLCLNCIVREIHAQMPDLVSSEIVKLFRDAYQSATELLNKRMI